MEGKEEPPRLNPSPNRTRRSLFSASSSSIVDRTKPPATETKQTFRINNVTPYKALFYSFLSGVFFSLNAVIVRYAKHVHPGQLALYRFLGMLVFSFPIAVHSNENVIGPKSSRLLLLCRAISAAVYVFFSFISFRHLPIGEASVIIFSTPVFVTIFARILLKEACGIAQTIIIGITTVGIILMVNPTTFLQNREISATDRIVGICSGLAALVFQCSMIILTRKTKNVHFSVVSVTTAFISAASCVLFTAVSGYFLFPCGSRHALGLVVGVSAFLGQILYIRAMQIDNLGPTVIVKASTDILVATMWQVILFEEFPDNYGITAAVLVTISVILTGVRKWILNMPVDSPVRMKLRILTY